MNSDFKDCKTNSAKCISIYCKFSKFPKGKLSTIVIKARLWNSTFIEDYSQVDWVRIISYGNLTVADSSIDQLEPASAVTLVRLAFFYV